MEAAGVRQAEGWHDRSATCPYAHVPAALRQGCRSCTGRNDRIDGSD